MIARRTRSTSSLDELRRERESQCARTGGYICRPASGVRAWLASQNALPGDTGFYRVSQGREVGHDAIIELRVDDDGEVWSGGRACTVVRGAIDWP